LAEFRLEANEIAASKNAEIFFYDISKKVSATWIYTGNVCINLISSEICFP
jgi:hypothetical protein